MTEEIYMTGGGWGEPRGQTLANSRSELWVAQNGNGLIWRVCCVILRASGSCTSQSKSNRSACEEPVSKTSVGCVIDTHPRGIEKTVGRDVKKADMLSVPIFATTYVADLVSRGQENPGQETDILVWAWLWAGDIISQASVFFFSK